MAENKLSWTELRRALAKRAGVSEKTAGTFLNSFATQLVEALKQDKQVKINGLGTFKLQAVAPRKSVNVKTGEEIVIEGYNKVVFAPEVGMKEMVEGRQPSAVSDQPVEAIDPIKKLGEQAEEIVGILAEIEQTKPEVEEEPVVEAPVEEEPVVKEPEPVVEEEPVVEAPVEEEPVVKEPEPVVVSEPEPEPVVSPKPKKKYHFLRDTLICVVILLMLLLCGYFFLRTHISEWIDSLVQPNPQTEMVVENDTVPSIIEEPIVEEPMVEETMVEEPQEEPYSELLTTEYITPGSRLTWIAKKYYGSKIYWPYIYEANKKEIPNPSKIAIGTPVRVPKLTKSQLDTVGVENRARLEKLRIEAEEACRK